MNPNFNSALQLGREGMLVFCWGFSSHPARTKNCMVEHWEPPMRRDMDIFNCSFPDWWTLLCAHLGTVTRHVPAQAVRTGLVWGASQANLLGAASAVLLGKETAELVILAQAKFPGRWDSALPKQRSTIARLRGWVVLCSHHVIKTWTRQFMLPAH